ncbi:DegT/DnrJ/EryC1/StrS family aminotransferase [Nitriliruptor alkaliphilus]|uniref:DegT/DnrJ/EryC1/StrS family aminotransferase n=1 Tax=Nitriliruptor alkaliphilus TaxID=427918 RepID=UPI00069667DA
MIPLAVPNLAGREAEYLQECITSTYVSTVGPFVGRLEEQVAAAAGTTGAVAVSTGTAGLHLALRVVGVGHGDLVAMPALTFIASANAVAYCGAAPWLFDVTPDALTMDPEQVADAFERDLEPGPDGPVHRPTGRRVAAVLPVHTLGHPADLDPLAATAHRHAIPVVADAAAALGARYRGRAIGQAGAAISVFSFNGNKTVTAGGGGALVSDDAALLARARHLSTTARVGSDYDHDEVGFNYRMTNVQAAVGCAQMEQLDTFVATKRRIQATYTERFSDLADVRPIPQASWADSACWFAGFSLEGWDADQVAALRAGLRDDGIDARPFWKPMHLQRPYADAPAEPLPVTEDVWQRLITLPCSTGITDDELGRVIAAVRGRLT